MFASFVNRLVSLKQLLIFVIFLLSSISFTSTANSSEAPDRPRTLWQMETPANQRQVVSSHSTVGTAQKESHQAGYQYTVFAVDYAHLNEQLARIDRAADEEPVHDLANTDANSAAMMSREVNADTSLTLLELPTPNGSVVNFVIFPKSSMAPELAEKYPSIRSYAGYELGNPAHTGRFDISPQGFYGVFDYQGQRIFIDPDAPRNTDSYPRYRVYDGNEALADEHTRPFDRVLEVHSKHTSSSPDTSFPDTSSRDLSSESTLSRSFGTDKTLYRLAVGTSGEYTTFHGGTVELGLAAVNTAIHRVNQIYERDLAIELQLVANNDQVIFTSALTDPYTNLTGDIDLNDSVLNTYVGSANYDVGHVFNTAGGGLAGLGVVCGTYKALGVTGLGSPTNDVFYIDYVAHELGHQFGAEHTFNGSAGACGGNRSGNSAYEPGSGSTIMGYAGICGALNIQPTSDALFHSHSIDQINDYISTGTGGTCGTTQSLGNAVPTVSAGQDYIIPASTPFVLRGAGNDTDAVDVSNLTFSWEQYDKDINSDITSEAMMIDDGTRPLFRTYLPSDSADRYLPTLSSVVNNISSIAEVLPTTNRNLNFRLIVRDGNGGVNMDSMVATVDNSAGPFLVTAPIGGSTLLGGGSLTVNWDVANTDAGNVNCQNVDILLSDDNGQTFDTSLLENTPNDGTESVTLPNAEIDQAYVMVACADNIFYDVSPAAFGVTLSSGVPVIIGHTSLTTLEDTPLAIALADLSVTDSDDVFPDNHTVIILPGDHYTYSQNIVTPNENYSGRMDVNVAVSDGVYTSASYPVEVAVEPVNDKPVITGYNGDLNQNEDVIIALDIADLTIDDPDNIIPDDFELLVTVTDHATYLGNNATSGIITLEHNYFGMLEVNVAVTDGDLTSETFVLQFDIAEVNDNPTANDDIFSIENNTTRQVLNILENDRDEDTNDVLQIASFIYSGTGEVALENGVLYYTPSQGFGGSDNLTYTVSDGRGGLDTGNVVIRVLGDTSQPVNNDSDGEGSGSTNDEGQASDDESNTTDDSRDSTTESNGGGGGSLGLVGLWTLLLLRLIRSTGKTV